MVIKKLVRSFLGVFKSIYVWAETEDKTKQKSQPYNSQNTVEESQKRVGGLNERLEKQDVKTVRSVWDYLRFNENTQAYHLNAVINFDEWIDMDEIRRRILELFGVEYKNEKSLYPYVKTLTDVGLFETVSAGGRRKWRKKSNLIVIEEERPEKSELTAKNREKEKKQE